MVLLGKEPCTCGHVVGVRHVPEHVPVPEIEEVERHTHADMGSHAHPGRHTLMHLCADTQALWHTCAHAGSHGLVDRHGFSCTRVQHRLSGTWALVHMCAGTQAFMHTCAHVCPHTCTHTGKHMHTSMHARTHVLTLRGLRLWVAGVRSGAAWVLESPQA